VGGLRTRRARSRQRAAASASRSMRRMVGCLIRTITSTSWPGLRRCAR
jgi:hypothetical protein